MQLTLEENLSNHLQSALPFQRKKSWWKKKQHLPRNNNFTMEAKPTFITLLGQHAFVGFAHEDLHNHLVVFYDLCGIIGVTHTEEENLYIRVFHFSLIRDALKWLNTCPSQSNIESKFLDCFFLETKKSQAKIDILSLLQKNDEPFCEVRLKSNHTFILCLVRMTFSLKTKANRTVNTSTLSSAIFCLVQSSFSLSDSPKLPNHNPHKQNVPNQFPILQVLCNILHKTKIFINNLFLSKT